ncbi:hypothetical protein HMJ29_11980 [Hymenobacter taeanensis]|uniref:Lipoprotein n=1 Tax=Hymenobacter taeanensis TaxID=2735321 RepID=A0A6M6BGH9_9BACT|nr:MULTISPECIES: hypothetical protein [Hymenobacter]QJX47621.1 hypothetical protein HMJ29_11980 [Hymenobacter taeanensis]UOQ82896.1 hypothetical protein MUN83_09100 [Hymenobacter sp. 5414T-23]
MRLISTSLLATLLLLGACSKDDDTIPMLMGQYRTESTIKAGTMQLHTSTGIITNQTTITRFLRRLNGASTTFLRRDSTITGASLELHFRENNRVTLASVVPPGADDHMTEMEVTTRAREYYLLSDLDSVSIYTSPSGYNANPCNELPDKIRQHRPARKCFNVSQASGFGQMCRLRPLRMLTIRKGQPVLSLFSWLGKSGSNGRWCWIATGFDWNSLNPNLRSSLAPGDTVVVQTNELALHKQ